MDFMKMMKEAKQMQQQMLKVQEELAEEKVEATSGGGVVKVVANGKQEILEIKIDPGVIDPNDIEMLEDMILVATNEAIQKSQGLAAQRLNQLTGGLNIPGMV